MTSDNDKIAGHIRSERERMGQTQVQVAKLMSVSQKWVHDRECCKVQVKVADLLRMRVWGLDIHRALVLAGEGTVELQAGAA